MALILIKSRIDSVSHLRYTQPMKKYFTIFLPMLFMLSAPSQAAKPELIADIKGTIVSVQKFIPESNDGLLTPDARRMCFMLGKLDINVQKLRELSLRSDFFIDGPAMQNISLVSDIVEHSNSATTICGFVSLDSENISKVDRLKVRLNDLNDLLNVLEMAVK